MLDTLTEVSTIKKYSLATSTQSTILGKGICHGDAGAGFYFKSQSSGKYFIMGTASIIQASESGCTWNHYALYTKISNYIEWLKTTIRNPTKFSVRFETRVDADTLSSGCTLPNYISYGTFNVFGMPYYAVNERVPLSSRLTLNCDNGTRIDFFCVEDEWLNLNGTKCRKPGIFLIDLSLKSLHSC